MPKLTAREITDKQIQRCQNAVEDVVKGIRRMKETPGKAANRKIQKYLTNVQKAVADGKVQEGNDSYSLSDFQSVAETKVRERYASGVAGAEQKILAAREQLNAHQQKIQDHVATMPDDTEAQREARMLYNKREMSKFKLQRARR
jgi:hypothetical protein